MGSRLLWAVILGFLSGVFVRSNLPLGLSCAAFAFLLASAFLACSFIDARRSSALLIAAAAVASGALGIVRMHAATLTGDSALTERLGSRVAIEGIVSQDPDVRDSGVRVDLNVHALMHASSSVAVSAGVIAELPAYSSVRYGDIVRVSGEIALPQPFLTAEPGLSPASGDAQNGRQFDYPGYLAESGISYVMTFTRYDVLASGQGNPLVSAIFDLKHRYLAGIEATLPEPEGGLASGITVGDKRSIGPDLSLEFQRVGLMQLVVLSGYNITVVANAAAYVLAGASRYVRFGSGIAVVIFFVLISGGASSAMRAGLMAAIALFARASRRTFDPLRALGVASLAMTAWNPFILVFDPGFQLSAVATAGLTLITPLVSSRVSWITDRFGLREIVSSTIATQCAVLPLLLYQSGQLGIYAVPANILAMMPVPLSMLASLVAAAAGMCFGSNAAWAGFPAYAMLALIIHVAHAFASLPYSSITIGTFGPLPLALSYATLAGIVYALGKKSDERMPPP